MFALMGVLCTTSVRGGGDNKVRCDAKKFKLEGGGSVRVPDGFRPCAAVVTLKKGTNSSCFEFCESQDQALKCHR